MTYIDYDTSISSGSPSELYKFTYWGTTYRYCTLDGGVTPFDYLIAGALESFSPITINHSALDSTEEMSRNSIEINVPSSFPVAQLFIAAPPEGVISVTIFRFHVNDLDKEYITSFKGRVISCSFRDDEATLTCEPIFTSLRRPGLRLLYDAHCPYGLYDSNCTLFRPDWAESASVVGVDGLDLTIQALGGFPDDWFSGGVFECGTVRRMITGNKADTLTLSVLHPVPMTVQGQACILYPGCDHTLTHCGGKFNNAINFGGFPWLPLKNPFSGDNAFW